MALDKKMNPLVSVIIPTYNRAGYIEKALESVFSQSYKDFEIIVVDDGSTDGTKGVLDSYLRDGRVRYLHQQNQRVGKARNNGISRARGSYIALLDSDDYWIDTRKLEKQVDFFETHPDYTLVSGGIIRVDERGQTISRTLNPETDGALRKAMLLSCLFAPSAVVFRKSDFEKIGGFNAHSDLSEDWELFFELGKLGKLYNFQDYFLAYLQGSQNRSNFNRRPNLRYNLGLISKYGRDYPNFAKAYAVHLCYYAYSFFPAREKMLPFFSRFKRLVFGRPAYRSE